MRGNTLYRIAISLETTIILLLMLFASGIVLGLVIRTLDDTKTLKRNRISLERTLKRMDPK
jgi:hypothetical protein